MNAGKAARKSSALAATACGLALLAAAGPATARQAGGPDPSSPDSSGGVTESVGAGGDARELVENGSFEAPQSPRAGLVGNFRTIPGWTETTGHGVEIQNGLAPTAEGGGAQYVELDSNGPSSIYQDVATEPGLAYRLTFMYAAHPGTSAAESAFDVTFGDTTQAIAPASGLEAAWRSVTMDVVAAEPATRLTFADATGPGRIRGLGVFIDLVSVTRTG